MSVFYERFERHEHGDGLKGRSTHYCPGCGHGLVHRYLAEAIEALGIQDRTVAISPVGCAVFLHYYLDVGHVQAAHGRAPAVALGHKLSRPESMVVSYQGDGDLASIGLAEIIHAAQLGIPLTVVFVNNAVFGMTGGQMAPTTLRGQRTTTTPEGRGRFMGEPLRIAELVAQLDGPVYVERVALFDNKQRVEAQKAIRKALQCQIENRGFALVELLAECPLHLGLTPREAQQWVKKNMLPVFPLGVKKDVTAHGEVWPAWTSPSFDPLLITDLIGGFTEAVPRFFDPPHELLRRDIAVKIAGAGGDGAQTVGLILARAALNEGFDATCLPSYGPQSRGGTSYVDVRIAPTEVLSPTVSAPDALVAFNALSLLKFGHTVADGGIVIYDSCVIRNAPRLERTRAIPVPLSTIAQDIGAPMAKNLVALGVLAAAVRVFPEKTLLLAIHQTLGGMQGPRECNDQAFAEGFRWVGAASFGSRQTS